MPLCEEARNLMEERRKPALGGRGVVEPRHKVLPQVEEYHLPQNMVRSPLMFSPFICWSIYLLVHLFLVLLFSQHVLGIARRGDACFEPTFQPELGGRRVVESRDEGRNTPPATVGRVGLQGEGLRMQGAGFRVQGVGCRVQVAVCRV